MKKALSLALTLCFTLLLLTPFAALPAAAVGGVQARFDAIMAANQPDAYFSVNGDRCNHASSYSCTNCQLSHILAARGISMSGYYDAFTCAGFARYVFQAIFEVPLLYTIDTARMSIYSEGYCTNANSVFENAAV